jgi:hypothetical protein
MAELCRLLGHDLKDAGISSQISISEAGFLTHLFERGNDSKRGFQIKEFFSPSSKNYIGDVPNMAHKISGHSYHTVKSDSIMNLVRSKLSEEIQRVDPTLDFWMSEYCILGGNGVITGGGRDLGMETALFVANIIHADLTVANASAWQWWIAVSPYDFKDGLVYIDKSETSGSIYESKLLWALGNYSRFVRPGAIRVGVTEKTDSDIKTSAFLNTDGKLVVVIINKNETEKNISLTAEPFKGNIAKRYETSEKSSLELLGNQDMLKEILIPGQSVSTFIFNN